MENENSICSVCFLSYDADHHLPRVLINCGHTLCSCCLTEILKSPQLQRCPFDNLEFEKAQRCLENFPVNFALLALLEGSNQSLCQIHKEPFTMVCLKDREKICMDCAIIGKHNGHPVKKIKDLKAKGMKIKTDLKESLLKFEKFQSEKHQEMERKSKEFFTQMTNKFEDIRMVLRKKEIEWADKIENLLKRSMEDDSQLLLRWEAEETLDEIDQELQNERDLAFLDQDFGSIISGLQPQNFKENAFEFPDVALRMMDCIESFLASQTKSIQNFQLLSERIEPEQITVKKEESEPEQITVKKEESEPEQLSSEDFEEAWQSSAMIKAKTRLILWTREDSLFLDMKNPNPIFQMVDLDALSETKKVNIELGQYQSLFQESTDLTVLSEILKKLKKYTSLKVVFTPLGLNDDQIHPLFNHLFVRIQHLEEIAISFEQCQITNVPIFFFLNSTAFYYLRSFTLKLGSTLISDLTLIRLAQFLSSQGLESLTLGVGKTAITDAGIEKIFNVILGLEVLNLDLKGTLVTDNSLKVFRTHMKNLKGLILDASDTKITTVGVDLIFAGIPKEMKWLHLDFSHVKLSDQVVSLFEEKIRPKLELAESVRVILEGTDLAKKTPKMPKSLRSIIKEAEERKRSGKDFKVNNFLSYEEI